ncbi:MAG TPA: FHA domain-containing protein [Polyangia bacterium]|nr:FHA domain-containing protein [Polyangia bacterium]
MLAKLPTWWVYAAIVGGVVLLGLIFLIVAAARKPKRREQRCKSCRRVMMPDWDVCRFCKTAVNEVKAELEFVSGPLTGQTVGLDRDITTIGSVAGNTVLLNDTGVSRKHVGIKRVDGGYELADLGSTNGVYVNGEKVARRKLSVGDVIRVGTTEIVFRT